MSTPRKHHYVPRTYLAGFTNSEGRLYVLDRHSGRQWLSNPNDAGCERDFYLLEFDEDSEEDALAVESFFANVESAAKAAITHALRTGQVPEGDLRVKLVGFLAAQAVRVPGALKAWDDFSDDLMKRVSWYLTATPETWAAHVERMKEAGDPVPDVPYEKIREFVLSEDYTATFDQNTRLGSAWPPPGLGLLGTTVMFPLDRRHALVGMFEQPFPTTKAGSRLVGVLNMWTAFYATKYIYSAEADFHVTLPDGRPGNKDDLLRHFATERDRTRTNRT